MTERSADQQNLIVHDVIREIINKRIYPDYCNNKIIRKEILRWCEGIHDNARIEILNKRCVEVKEIEKERGIVIKGKAIKKNRHQKSVNNVKRKEIIIQSIINRNNRKIDKINILNKWVEYWN